MSLVGTESRGGWGDDNDPILLVVLVHLSIDYSRSSLIWNRTNLEHFLNCVEVGCCNNHDLNYRYEQEMDEFNAPPYSFATS